MLTQALKGKAFLSVGVYKLDTSERCLLATAETWQIRSGNI